MTNTHKPIRSFVIRQSRMSVSQKRALLELWDKYGLELSSDHQTCFGNDNPVTIEIGFGMGDSLLEMVARYPERNFIGIEVHRPGIGHLIKKADEQGLSNLRVFSNDSIEVLTNCIEPESIQCVQIFFPDPWPKKRHHKRRLINAALLDVINRVLEPGGILHIATDWQPYAAVVRQLLDSDARFEQIEPPQRVETKYERRGLRLGHLVTDLAVHKINS